jgi:hypothetical protein
LQEWSRLLERYEQQGWIPKLRKIYNEISTNTLSLIDSFRAACMKMTSIIFKVSFVSELLALLCSIVAQGPSRCLFSRLSPRTFLARNIPIEVPWSADKSLVPSNGGLIRIGKLGTSWTYLEQVVGVSVADTSHLSEQKQITPLGASISMMLRMLRVNVAAPTLPPATNQSYILVSLDSFGISQPFKHFRMG